MSALKRAHEEHEREQRTRAQLDEAIFKLEQALPGWRRSIHEPWCLFGGPKRSWVKVRCCTNSYEPLIQLTRSLWYPANRGGSLGSSSEHAIGDVEHVAERARLLLVTVEQHEREMLPEVV